MISTVRYISAAIFAFVLLLFCARSAVSAASPQTTLSAEFVSAVCSQADSGDSNAKHRLTQFLLQHDSSDSDFVPAFDCLRASATRGNPDAQFLLGYLFEQGHGVPRDISVAAKYYQAASDHGHAAAQNNLAALYQHGHGVPRDLRKAFDLYTVAAQHGNPVAQTNLASMYYTGGAIPRDYASAVQWFHAAADQGDSTAQHDLGVLYYLGLGVARDLTAAARLEGLAAVHGNPLAQTDLAYFYEIGSGLSQDYFAAFLWYSRAIAAGDIRGFPPRFHRPPPEPQATRRSCCHRRKLPFAFSRSSRAFHGWLALYPSCSLAHSPLPPSLGKGQFRQALATDKSRPPGLSPTGGFPPLAVRLSCLAA